MEPDRHSKKPKPTPEQVRECARLEALWNARKHRSQTAFGLASGIGTQGNVNHYLKGRQALNLEAALAFAAELGVNIAEFSPRLAADAERVTEAVAPADGEFVDVKRVDVRLSAGSGALEGLDEVIGSLKFSAAFLRSCGVSPAGARVVNVAGHSMDPTIKDGAVLLISTNNREPVDGAIFALARPCEGLIVKRLRRAAGRWVATSDNRDFADIAIGDGEPLEIIGRAVWMGAKL